MSNNRSRRGVFAARLSVAAALTAIVGTSLAGPRHKKEPELTLIQKATYRIVQMGEEVGTESYTRRVYDNNTVVYEGRVQMTPALGMDVDQEFELVVEEESFFPRRYRGKKTMSQGDNDFEHRVDVDMYANVAVVNSTLRTTEQRRTITVPSGTALIETGVTHQIYPLLYWYNEEVGGRQKFQVLDVMTRKINTAVMQRVEPDTLTVMDSEVPVTMYLLERENQEVRVFVDVDGRIVRMSMYHAHHDLIDWSEEKVES